MTHLFSTRTWKFRFLLVSLHFWVLAPFNLNLPQTLGFLSRGHEKLICELGFILWISDNFRLMKFKPYNWQPKLNNYSLFSFVEMMRVEEGRKTYSNQEDLVINRSNWWHNYDLKRIRYWISALYSRTI